jgi:hypothetical protein
MINRAQAEALLTLAESLEACHRIGIFLDLPETACDSASIDIGGYQHHMDCFSAISIRLAVNALIPKSET